MTPALAAVVAYMSIQLAIGVWISRRIHTESDYLVAGRNLGYGLATFSIFATWFGAETVVGSAGIAYREGVSLASAEPFGYGLCLLLMGLIFAVPLWRRRLTTLADLYRERYSTAVERLAAVILIPSSILWAAAQVRAFGYVLSTATTNIDGEVAIAIAAGVTILYTMFGGLLVDAITDVIQGVMLVIGLFVVLVAAMTHSGGPAGAIETLRTVGPIQLLPAAGSSALAVLEAWAIPICGSVVATELVGRIVATRSPEVARRSSILAGTMYLVIGLIPLVIGLLGQRILPGLAEPEQLVPTVARELLPTVLYALFAGGLISAILSTVDSTLLVSSGILSHNLIVPSLGIRDERTKLRIARAGVVVFGCIAYALALHAEGVFALVEQASSFGSAGVLVTVCFGLFSPIGGPQTAAATLATGVITYLGAVTIGVPYPFLLSLAAALAVYLIGAAAERPVPSLERT
jgi:SSS family solute:Na+ symporter